MNFLLLRGVKPWHRLQHQKETPSLPCIDSGHNRECGEINADEVGFVRDLVTVTSAPSPAVTPGAVIFLIPHRISKTFESLSFFSTLQIELLCPAVNIHHTCQVVQGKAEDGVEVDSMCKKQMKI